MVKHSERICRQKPTNCLSVFDHFVGLAHKGLRFVTTDSQGRKIYFKYMDMFTKVIPFGNIWENTYLNSILSTSLHNKVGSTSPKYLVLFEDVI